MEVPEGSYFISAQGYRYADVDVDSDRKIVLQDIEGSMLEMTVVDAETGDPVPDATIDGECDLYYNTGDEFITDESSENGVVEAYTGVTPTSCTATVYAKGYQPRIVSIDVPTDDGQTVQLNAEDDDAGSETNR